MKIRLHALALLLAGCDAAPPAPRQPEAPQAVRTVRVAMRAVGDSVALTGTLVPREEVQVAPDLPGHRVLRVLVEEGDRVAAGAVLAVLDPAPLAGELARAGIAARRAAAERRRAAGLDGRGVLTDEAIAQRGFEAEAAVATLREVERRRARLVLRAPVVGIVIARRLERGEVSATGGEPAFRIARGGAAELEAGVAEDALAALRPGARAVVTLADGTTVTGHVRRVAARLDPRTLLAAVRIALPHGPRPVFGGTATATIAVSGGVGPAVPASAIRYTPGGASVMPVGRDGRTRRMTVVPGTSDGGWVALRRGPPAGTELLADGGALVLPGDRVRSAGAAR